MNNPLLAGIIATVLFVGLMVLMRKTWGKKENKDKEGKNHGNIT